MVSCMKLNPVPIVSEMFKMRQVLLYCGKLWQPHSVIAVWNSIHAIVSKGNPSPFVLDDWTQIWQGWQGMECWHAFIIKKTEPTGGVLGADVEDQTCSHLRIQSWSAQNTSSSTICCVYINACVPWNIIMLFAGPFKTAALVNGQMLDHHSPVI